MTAILLILIIISLLFNLESLKNVVIAELPEASWKEIYKMAVNLAIIIYLYEQVPK